MALIQMEEAMREVKMEMASVRREAVAAAQSGSAVFTLAFTERINDES